MDDLRKSLIYAIVVGCLLFTSAASGQGATFYLHDGRGVFADQHPPTSWDAATGKHIRWKAKLPNWSNGSPIIVQGKVLTLAEPLDYAPLLVCHDAETGKELWRRELDPVAALPPDEQAEARKLAREMWQWRRDVVTLWNEMFDFTQKHAEHFKSNDRRPDDQIRPQFEKLFYKRLDDLGLKFTRFKSGAGGYQTIFEYKERRGPMEQRENRLREAGLGWAFWSPFGTWDGITFPTPASDGQRVFTVTAQNLYSCHDLEGNLLWQRRFDWPNRRKAKAMLDAQQQKRTLDPRRGETGWPFNPQGYFCTAPVVVEGRLISMAGAWIRCLDGATGRTVWEMPMRGGIGQNFAVPGVIRLSGEAFVIVAPGEGRVGEPGDDIIRVRDGKIVGILPGYTSAKMSIASPIIEGDMVIAFSGDWRARDVSAFRLSYDAEAEKVAHTRLWTIPRKKIRDLRLWRVPLHEGKLYSGDLILDAKTGKLVRDRLQSARRRYCWWSSMIVGDHYLSIDHSGGAFHFRDLKTHKTVAENTLPLNPSGGASEALKMAQTRGGQWNVLGAANPVPYKDRLYIRSFDYLWCIGK